TLAQEGRKLARRASLRGRRRRRVGPHLGREGADLGENAVDFHLAHGWTPSGSRYVDARLAQACELVAQGARADAEVLGRFASAALMMTQRIQDEIALGLYQ